jgi:hypothetical protein
MILRSGKIINIPVIMATSATTKSFCCHLCNLLFTEKNFDTILKHSHEEHPKCKQCEEIFLGLTDLQNHKKITDHCHCRECDKYFPNVREQLDHVRKSTHATPHLCCDCGREYTNQETLRYHCCDCDEVHRNKNHLRQHVRGVKHICRVHDLELERSHNLPHKCKECDEQFHSKRKLKEHMSSSHRPPRRIQCPIGGNCKKKFATPSALLNHLESGCCSSGMTCAEIHQLVIAHDTNRYITSVEAAEPICSSEHASARYFFLKPQSAEVDN